MKDKYTILLLVLAGYTSLQAQVPNGIKDISISTYHGEVEEIQRSKNYEFITGSPYHLDHFTTGIIAWNDGDTLQRYMRYNAHTDEMEFVEEGKAQVLRALDELDYVWLNDQLYRYKNFILDSRISQSFMIELTGGDCRLYKRDWIEFKPRVEAVTSYHQATPDKFVEKPVEYYYSCDDNNLMPFPYSKKEQKAAFDGMHPDHDDFIKKNKLKLRREEDLIGFFDYLNRERG